MNGSLLKIDLKLCSPETVVHLNVCHDDEFICRIYLFGLIPAIVYYSSERLLMFFSMYLQSFESMFSSYPI